MKTGEKRTWPKQPRKSENERPLSSSSTLLRTSAKGGCKEKIARIKNEYATVLVGSVWVKKYTKINIEKS